MTAPLRFGIVGAGRAAQLYAQAFQQCAGAVVIGVADLRPEAARAMAEGLGCRAYASFDALADTEPLDAAVVCTPPASHAEVSRHLLRRRIHVLCEKPFTLDGSSARAVIAAAADAGVLVTMASKFRYVEDVVRAKSLVLSGAIGEPVVLENAFATKIDMTSRWNSDPAVSGGGVLIDNGTHSVDLARYFLGPLAAVQAVEARRTQALAVEDTTRLSVRSAAGALASIDLSWSIDKEDEAYVRIYGTHGTVLVGWKQSRYRQSSSPNWVVFGQGYDKIRAVARQIMNFAAAIRGEESLLIGPEDALACVEVIEAAYAALRSNQWIAVGEPADGARHSPRSGRGQ